MKPRPTILIRADASPEIGTGHVMRCLALAEALMEQGALSVFCGAQITPALVSRLADAGFTHHRIDAAEDAAATQALCRSLAAKGLVVDSYTLDSRWRAALHQPGLAVLALDDLADRMLHADLVWNPAPARAGIAYDRLAPNAIRLFGDDYVLIRREIRDLITTRRPPLPDRNHLLVTFGGSDPAGLTVPVIKRLGPMLPSGVVLDVVVGGSNPNLACCRAAASRFPACRLHVDSRDMGRLIAESGLAITAGGGTVAEMAALATPTLLVAIADNQAGAADDARHRDWAEVLDARGHPPGAMADIIAATALALWHNPTRRTDLARRIAGIDGQGAPRVAAALLQVIQMTG